MVKYLKHHFAIKDLTFLTKFRHLYWSYSAKVKEASYILMAKNRTLTHRMDISQNVIIAN